MKNPQVIIVIAIVVTVIGIGAYSFFQNSSQSDSMMKDDANAPEGAMMKKDDTMMNHGAYLPYTKALLDNTSDSRRVLFFYANWCPTCRPADANFNENMSKIPEDVTLIRVNYNDTDTDQEEKDLAEKYSVTYQHTFVQIDSSGEEVTKWNGGQTDELLSQIR